MVTARAASNKENLTPVERNQRRRLIFQDGLALFGLTIIAICIAVLTYFFFHSFEEHRRVLEKRWYDRGEKALSVNRPAEAVEDFRSALSFSSSNTAYQMALAEALAASGRTEEAYVYYSTLREAEPGDGFLNLQLARLAVRRKNPQEAIAYYQAALNGFWPHQGTEQRRAIRLELAPYELSLGRTNDAQGELLGAEGDSLDNPSALFQIAGLLQQASDPSDAWTTYQRVEHLGNAKPSQVLASLLDESKIAASMGQYKRAAQALDRYMAKARQYPAASTPEQRQVVQQHLNYLQHMLQLIPFDSLPPKVHDERLLLVANIAHKRYVSCMAQLQTGSGANEFNQNVSSDDAAAFSALGTQWTQFKALRARDLAGNAPLQQSLTAWTNQTELQAAKLCGAPTGDDALLLQLAQTPDKTE